MNLKAYASLKRAGVKISRNGKINVKDVHAAIEVLSANRSGSLDFPVEITRNPETKSMTMHLGVLNVDITGTLDIADEAFADSETEEFEVQLAYQFSAGAPMKQRGMDPPDPPEPDDVQIDSAKLVYDGKIYDISDKCLALKVGKHSMEEDFIDRIIDHEYDNGGDEGPDDDRDR